MARKKILGALAVVAAATAVVVVKQLTKNKKTTDENGTDEEIHFIELDDESGDEEESEEEDGETQEYAHPDSVSLDEESELLDETTIQKFSAELPDEDLDAPEEVKEIAEIYPFLSMEFIADVLEKNAVFLENFPQDTLIAATHHITFDDTPSLINFGKIVADAGYICEQIDEHHIDVTKRFFSEDGAVISDILNVANQAEAVGGRYSGYEMNQ